VLIAVLLGVQMLQVLAPGGILQHDSAPQMFCSRLLQDGSLPIAKVNLEATAIFNGLSVGHFPCLIRPVLPVLHVQCCLCYQVSPPTCA